MNRKERKARALKKRQAVRRRRAAKVRALGRAAFYVGPAGRAKQRAKKATRLRRRCNFHQRRDQNGRRRAV